MNEDQPQYKPVDLDWEVDPGDNTFRDGDKCWRVTTLIHKSKDLEPFDLPLCCINLATQVWGENVSVKSFARHFKRMEATGSDYPVILDDDGFIMDGWHRVAKALAQGKATIKAVRFAETPEPDYYKGDA